MKYRIDPRLAQFPVRTRYKDLEKKGSPFDAAILPFEGILLFFPSFYRCEKETYVESLVEWYLEIEIEFFSKRS